MFTRKHFVLFARKINEQCKRAKTPEEREKIESVLWPLVDSFAIEFKALNKNFDRAKFIDACFDGS